MAFAVALSLGEVFPQRCPEMPAPVAQMAVYPVFDSSGTLARTVSLLVEQPAVDDSADVETRDVPATTASRRYRVSLTDREVDVLRHIVAGATNPEIAALMNRKLIEFSSAR